MEKTKTQMKTKIKKTHDKVSLKISTTDESILFSFVRSGVHISGIFNRDTENVEDMMHSIHQWSTCFDGTYGDKIEAMAKRIETMQSLQELHEIAKSEYELQLHKN